MKNTISFFPNFVAQIHLRKEKIFGLKDLELSLLITPSLKIIKILNEENIDFLYSQGDTIKVEEFSKWVVENGYDFKFLTKSKSLKRILILDVESYIDDLKKTPHDTTFKKLIKWFKI
jgi:hypothetical protein